MTSIDEIKEYLSYDPETGEIRWIKTGPLRRVQVGDIAGTIKVHKSKYVARLIKFNQKWYIGGRLAWAMHYGEWPHGYIDHINGDATDNSISNLRVVSHAENCKNRKRPSKNTSGHVGVCKNKNTNRWAARIGVNRKLIHLGEFDDINDAIKARKEAEKKYGFHENHGRSK